MLRLGPDLREPNYTQKIGLHFTNRNGPIFRVNRSFWSTVYNQDFNFERRAPTGQVIVTVIYLFPPIFPLQKCRCFTWRRRMNRITKLVNRGHEQPQHYRSLLFSGFKLQTGIIVLLERYLFPVTWTLHQTPILSSLLLVFPDNVLGRSSINST